jgi:DNA-binding transcriptional ArsR family regulator
MNSSLPQLQLTNGSTPLKVDLLHSKKAAMILRALNHKLRQQIVKLIDEHQKMTVTEIYVKLRLEQSVASQHLAILRRAGIVVTTREGKFIFYTVKIQL